MNSIFREPLLHFALLGAVIFGVNAFLNDGAAKTKPQIEITAADIEHLRALWQRTWQRPPTPKELQGAIDARVREEILYREALAMGLDKDDTVIRRRLVQKLEFLSEGVATSVEPNSAELHRYLKEHAERYREPARLSFMQVYFNTDRHGPQTETITRKALQALSAGGGSPMEAGRGYGDRFVLGYAYGNESIADISHKFGQGFADAIAPLPPGRWHGPIASGYGLHLVYIEDRTPARTPPLAEVRDAVLHDYEQAKREKVMQAFYERLKQRYHIVIDEAAFRRANHNSELRSEITG